MADRDPALIAGPTAQQWDGRSRIALGFAGAMIPVALIGVALGARPTPSYLVLFAGLLVAGFVAWLALGQVSLRTLKAEMAAGYSTMLDVPGYALRHPLTGALQRAADVPPVTAGRRRSFLLDNFRIRADTWAARSRDDDPPESDGPVGRSKP